MFQLATPLANDCFTVLNLPLSRLLLMNDCQYPWFILVPRVDDITEIHQLPQAQQHQLLLESNSLSVFLEKQFSPDKINIAALGNMVPQLHVHHVARFKNDPSWPKPIWAQLPAKPYQERQALALVEQTKLYFEQLNTSR